MFEPTLLKAARAATIGRVHAGDALIVTSGRAKPRWRPTAGESLSVARIAGFDADLGAMRLRLAQAIRRPQHFDLIIVYVLIDCLTLSAAMATARALGERLTRNGWLMMTSGGQVSEGELLAVAAASGLLRIGPAPRQRHVLIMARS